MAFGFLYLFIQAYIFPNDFPFNKYLYNVDIRMCVYNISERIDWIHCLWMCCAVYLCLSLCVFQYLIEWRGTGCGLRVNGTPSCSLKNCLMNLF